LKVLERAHALQEAGAQHAPEAQMQIRFHDRVARRANPLFQRLDDGLVVVRARKLLQTLL
jgi:hypothetical protein